ncbi:unnamed protein product [Prunus armeniaca]
MLITAILNFPPLPNFTELRSRLLSFETHAPWSSSDPAAQSTALMAAQSSRPPRGGAGLSQTSHVSRGNGGNDRNGGWNCNGSRRGDRWNAFSPQSSSWQTTSWAPWTGPPQPSSGRGFSSRPPRAG